MSARQVAAVDLGATSGRVMLASVGPNVLGMRSVARFPNDPVRLWDGTRAALHWDLPGLFGQVCRGLGSAAAHADDLVGIGVDSWAVDYALLRGGRLLGLPHHYRDTRSSSGVAPVHDVVAPDELFRRNGLQFLPFATVYQLAAERDSGVLALADRALLIPDLVAYWLTGRAVVERTNASTTGLYGVDGMLDVDLCRRLGVPADLFPEQVGAGTALGPVLFEIAEPLGIGPEVTVSTVASHDTASAVVAVPMDPTSAAYISCGTWGLVGVEVPRPIVTREVQQARFTNEAGADGRTRLLHNVMGLWLLSESVRQWERGGDGVDLAELLAQAAGCPPPVAVFDTDDPRFLPPGDVPGRIAQWYTERELPVPPTRPHLVRAIVDSLAAAFSDAVGAAAALSGVDVRRIHIVGGGALNALLCQSVADRVGVPVLAGPVEATALGNVLIQARTHGLVRGDLEALRALVAAAFSPREYTPRSAVKHHHSSGMTGVPPSREEDCSWP